MEPVAPDAAFFVMLLAYRPDMSRPISELRIISD